MIRSDINLGKRINRTGIDSSPIDGKATIEGARAGLPSTAGDGQIAMEVRRSYARDSEPLGTVPPPASIKGAVETAKAMLKGEKATFLIDKLAERLAFERTGVRLYDQVLVAFDAKGSFPGGPTRAQLERIQMQEAEHFAWLDEMLRGLGGDSTAVTPLADLVGVESMGILAALAEPRRTLAEALHAIHLAELADADGWQMLMSLCEDMEQDKLAEGCVQIVAEESEHLRLVRKWLQADARIKARIMGEVREAVRPS